MKPTNRLGVFVSLAAALALAAACSSSTPSTSAGSSGTTTAANTPPPSTASSASSSASTPTAATTHTADTGTMSAAAGAATAAAGGVTGLLGTNLGLTSDQSSGAVGSFLSLAQEKLPASDYTQVANAVPGAAGYVQKAKDLGVVTGPIGDVNGLNAAYSKLGISPTVASQITPLISNYIGKAAGPTVGGLLSSVLK